VVLPHVDRPFVERNNDRQRPASSSLYELLAVKRHCLSGTERTDAKLR